MYYSYNNNYKGFIYSGAIHTKIDLSWIDLSSLWESVHTHLDRYWIDLSSHLSVHIQITSVNGASE